MANYDASITINTKTNTKSSEVQLERLENRIVKTTDEIVSLRSEMNNLKDAKIPTQEFKNLQKELDVATKEMERMLAQDSKIADIDAKIEKLSQSASEYAAKMKEIANQKIPTEAYASVEKQIIKTENALNSLRRKQEKFLTDGGDESSDKYKKMVNEAQTLNSHLQNLLVSQERLEKRGLAFTLGTDTEQYKNLASKYKSINTEIEKQKAMQSEIAQKQADAVQKVIELKAQMNQLVEAGKAFTLGQDTEEFANLCQQLKSKENELAVSIKQHEVLELKQKKAAEGYKKLGNVAKKSLEKINNTQKKSTGLLDSFGKRLKSIIAATFIFNTIRKAFTSLINGIKEGFKNLYEGNERFKSSVDSLKASAMTLKNSLAAAFSPLVEIAIPYIQRFIEWLTKAVNLIGQFIAALTGRKTYTKAIKQSAMASEEAAESTEDETEAMNKQLSPLDKLNVLTSEKAKEKDKDDDLGDGAGTMFEEVPIDNKILDFLQKLKDFLQPIIDYAKKLKDIFMQGFWDGLGDWEYRWESIKNSLKSIKDSLIDIWTGPAVLVAADSWAQSVAYMLGSFVGSLASIGLTIASNILGGIAKYLEQNKDRIKEYLISMFNIWEEINNMFAELFQSIAYVFEAFASEQGQQLTANIIGIFMNAFMGITELASKLFRDIFNIFIQPFVDNKEAFRTALEGFLGVLAEVTGTIKQGIDDTFDKLNEVYDEYFKPFFDSVAQGLSDLVGKFMEFWNGSVQPILEQWAADFDELWKSHIQPLLDKAAEFLGKIADLLKVVWENYLQPMIAWIIENVLPKILPVIQEIWNTLKNLAGYIADMIGGVIEMLGGLIDFITGVLSGDWGKAFQGLQDIVSGFAETIRVTIEGGLQLISDIFGTFIETAKSAIDLFLQAIEKTVEICINFIKENLVGKFDEIKTGFSNFKTNVYQIWSNLWNGIKEKVRSILQGVKDIVGSAIDWIVSKIQSVLDFFGQFQSAAKSMTSGKLGVSMGSPFGNIKSVSYTSSPYAANPAIASLSEIEFPGYATGQVIPRTMRQHLAILGDNNQETEVVSPLSTIEQAVRNVIGGAQPQEINLNLTVECEGYQLLQIMQKLDGEYFKQTGKHAFA